MEFAKEVELQTPEFQTKQENIAAYIDRVWNTAEELLKDWGKAVCVLSAGNHDMVIANITTVEYIQNVKFMLTNMMDSCVHMIWLGSTADIKDYQEHIQTKEKMKLMWYVSVKKMIEVEPTLHCMMSFIDFHNASLTHALEDHIHMDQNWYKLLGDPLWNYALNLCFVKINATVISQC